jgi:hypothetical protein
MRQENQQSKAIHHKTLPFGWVFVFVSFLFLFLFFFFFGYFKVKEKKGGGLELGTEQKPGEVGFVSLEFELQLVFPRVTFGKLPVRQPEFGHTDSLPPINLCHVSYKIFNPAFHGFVGMGGDCMDTMPFLWKPLLYFTLFYFILF